jgi:hypothetical protein
MRLAHRGGVTYAIDTSKLGRPPANNGDSESSRTPTYAPNDMGGSIPHTVTPGHRETDERPRFLAFSEALRAIVTAQRTLPDPRVVVSSNPEVGHQEAFAISAWWARYAGLLRDRAERSS